jgi:uncharacterized protein (DUF433 family)/DNA-binding transcriptional MerR regulator
MSVTTFTPAKNRRERALGLGVYTSQKIARLSAVPVRSLGYWKSTGLVVPRVERGAPGHPSLYTYIDLCELRVIAQLRGGGLSLPKIRRALRYLKTQLPTGESWYRTYQLRTDGQEVFTIVKSTDKLADIVALPGAEQKVVVAFVGDIVRQFESDPALAYLREFVAYVDINPNVLAGAPVVKHTRLGTSLVASLVSTGWTERMIRDAYPTLTANSIDKAWRFEKAIGGVKAA